MRTAERSKDRSTTINNKKKQKHFAQVIINEKEKWSTNSHITTMVKKVENGEAAKLKNDSDLGRCGGIIFARKHANVNG